MRPFQIVQDSAALTLTNRDGALVHLPPPSAETTRTPCWAPSETLIVTATGDVLLCYEDARREHVLGNGAFGGVWDITPVTASLNPARIDATQLRATRLAPDVTLVTYVSHHASRPVCRRSSLCDERGWLMRFQPVARTPPASTRQPGARGRRQHLRGSR